MVVRRFARAAILSCLVIAAATQTLDPGPLADASTDRLPQDDTTESGLRTSPRIETLFNGTISDETALDQVEPDQPINVARVRSVPLSNNLFDIRDRVTERKRQLQDRKYTLFFSHDVVASRDHRLFALEAPSDIVAEVLDNAVRVAAAHDPTEFRESFNSTINNLTLVVNAIGSTPARPTFNWAVYGVVASTLRNSTARGPDNRTDSWVAVVESPSGALIAEMLIIPNVIVLPSDTSSTPVAATTSVGSTASGAAEPGSNGRLARRILSHHRPVRLLHEYSLRYGTLGAFPIDGQLLVDIMNEALDVIIAEYHDVAYYLEYFHGGAIIAPVTDFVRPGGALTVTAAATEPPSFQLRVRPQRVSLPRDRMLAILEEIRRIAYSYRRRDGVNAYAIHGTVEHEGYIIADWELGQPPSPAMRTGARCPVIQRRYGRVEAATAAAAAAAGEAAALAAALAAAEEAAAAAIERAGPNGFDADQFDPSFDQPLYSPRRRIGCILQ
ncbi:MAG: hypothetical protein M1817_000317 [Caeruleum heppii]|nr:MAG: hypothetical protein M1817_000317 [Caeruleum heppii]